MLSIFSCAFWPSVYLHWRNVYLGPVLIFWLDCLHHELIYYETCLRKNLRPASKVVSLERNCCHFYISHEGNVIYNKLFTWDCLISRQCEFDMQTCCDVDLRLWNLKKETNKQTNVPLLKVSLYIRLFSLKSWTVYTLEIRLGNYN